MKTIALVACVKEKKANSAPAIELYEGSDFESWVRDARSRNADEIYILSGKYGLLELDDIIEPYDLNLGKQDDSYIKRWRKTVIRKLRSKHILNETHAIFYTNPIYSNELIHLFKSYEVPLEIE